MGGKEDQVFERGQDELKRWPYSIHAVDDTLDTGLIEGRGRQILFQALSSRNIVAVVGSGLSQAYGRLSWSEWLDRQLGFVDENAKAFETCAKALSDFLEATERILNQVVPPPDKYHIEAVIRFLETRQQELAYRRAELAKLHATLKDLRAEGKSFSEMSPLTFQVAEKLHNQLRRHQSLLVGKAEKGGKDANNVPSDLYKLLKNVTENNLKGINGIDLNPAFAVECVKYNQVAGFYGKLIDRPEAQLSFTEFVKVLLVDECAHAESILDRAVKDGPAGGRAVRNRLSPNLQHAAMSTDNLIRNIKGIRENPNRYASLAYFKTDVLMTLADKVKTSIRSTSLEAWSDTLDTIITQLGENKNRGYGRRTGVERKFVSPPHRFILESMSALLAEPTTVLGDCVKNNEIDPSDFSSRLSIIDEETDPISKIVTGLGIRQFLTFNYDFEIERYFQDRGYRRFTSGHANGEDDLDDRAPLADDFRIDGLGGVLKDGSFSRENAADLISFAVDQDGADASVFHMHGQAAKDARIVVTERDYMDLYLSRDHNRDTVNEAIQLAFSASPLLFVGVGMEESDIMRPLRQFMSDKDRPANRTAVVLLPGSNDRVRRTKDAAALYLRYGIHTIFYGSGFVTIDGKPVACDWLHCVSSLIGELLAINKKQLRILIALVQAADREAPVAEKMAARQAMQGFEATKDDMSSNPFHPRWGPKRLFMYLDRAMGNLSQNQSVLGLLFGKEVLVHEEAPQTVKLARCYWRKQQANSTCDDSTDPYLQFEYELIGRLFWLTINRSGRIDTFNSFDNDIIKAIDGKDARADSITSYLAHISDLNARIAALEGLKSSLLTGVLSATFDKLQKDWRMWWAQLQASPPHREARAQALAHVIGLPARHVRHNISQFKKSQKIADTEPVQRNWLSYEDTVKNSPTGVLAFDNFLEAIQQRTEQDNKDFRLTLGRRLHLVAADRGQGKGTFLTAFSTPAGLSQYIASSWPETEWSVDNKPLKYAPKPSAVPPEYLDAVFVSLSFSTEISSVLDMLTAILEHCIVEMNKLSDAEDFSSAIDVAREGLCSGDYSPSPESSAELESLVGLSRIAKIAALLRLFHEKSQLIAEQGSPSLRFLLAIGSADLFNYRAGMRKNREIAEFLDLLLSPVAKEYPFDLVLISSAGNLGWPFVKSTAFYEQYQKAAAELTPGSPTSSAHYADPGLVYIPIVRKNIDQDGIANVQRRAKKSGIQFQGKIEANTATGLGIKPLTLPADKTTSDLCTVYFSRSVKPQSLLRDNFFYLYCALALRNWSRSGESDKKKLLAEVLEFARSSKGVKAIELSDKTDIVLTAADDKNLFKVSYADLFPVAGDNKRDDSDREWANLKSSFGGNRFCLTIILAAAERIAKSGRSLLEGAEMAAQFIQRTVDHADAVGNALRGDAVVEDVLNAYEVFHEAGEPEADIELHMHLLRHLAVIGAPCSADILVRAPEIRHYFDNLAMPAQNSRFSQTLKGLETLRGRGLVFEIAPLPGVIEIGKRPPDEKHLKESLIGKKDPENELNRFALHRLVQRHIITKMGAGPSEFAEINSFSPSLFPSMPADLPRLSPDAYRFLRVLIASFSQYPDQQTGDTGAENWYFGDAPRVTQTQALRAALSITRSSFSVAVVSRFEDYHLLDPAQGRSPRGYFEVYRIHVRWLIRKAFELLDKRGDFRLETYSPKAKRLEVHALYRDEIVWLYNECGVVSLVQGDIRAAIGMFRQAIAMNRCIEGKSDGGAHHNRVSLNLAIAQIEAGRVEAAKVRLAAICESEVAFGNFKGRLWHLAHGYLGLVLQLSGDAVSAAKHYERAITILRAYQDNRACSVFCRHYGDLERSRSEFFLARKRINEAINFAQAGGHEDMHKRARLSMIQLEMADPEERTKVKTKTVAARIASLEEYGETMEMPSLLCDCWFSRSELLLEQGEATLAGTLLARQMALAKRMGMRLRLNKGMTAYARVLSLRGNKDQARKLLFTSLEMAKRNRNQLEIRRVEQAFDELVE